MYLETHVRSDRERHGHMSMLALLGAALTQAARCPRPDLITTLARRRRTRFVLAFDTAHRRLRVASGIYFVRLESKGSSATRRAPLARGTPHTRRGRSGPRCP